MKALGAAILAFSILSAPALAQTMAPAPAAKAAPAPAPAPAPAAKAAPTPAPAPAPAAKADAAKEAKAPTAQQNRMTDCNAKAKDMKGDDRKKFMSSCLKGEDVAKAGGSEKQQAQRNKMASCNKDAASKAMKGDDRKKFMSDCLKG